MRKGLPWVAIGLAACCGNAASASEVPPLVRLDAPVVLDGRVEEEAWQRVPAVPLTVFEPVYGGTPSQRTTIRVAYDEDSLYLAAELFDSEPAAVRVGSLYRDRYAGDDTVGLVVDSFNDDRNARWFYTTPAGMRGDAAVADDMASGQGDFNWNGHWHARAVQTDAGWSAEIRIPFSTLGFRPRNGQPTMSLGVYRWLPRHNERQVWPDVPPRWARPYAKPSKLADVGLAGIHSGGGLVLSPYVSAGTVDGPGGAHAKREAGLDARRGIGSAFTLDVSLNTDFAQVEADAQQINLTRFPLFFPEKRPFFLEHADIFDFQWEGDSRLFHTRRIGLTVGEPVRLWGGARLAGRAGPWDIGLLDVQGAALGDLRSENFGVLRVRRRSAGRSVIGGMLTTRTGIDGRFNATAGADLEWRVAGDEFLTLKAARSATQDGPAGERFLVRWQRRRRQGLSYEATFARASRGFEAGLGFDARADFAHGAGRAAYEWLRTGEGVLRRVTAELGTEAYRRNGDGHIDSAAIAPAVTLETQRGDTATFSASRRHEDAETPFELPGGVTVAAGTHGFQEAGLTLGTTSGRKLRTGAMVRAGSFYDGHRWSFAPSLTWNTSRHLELGAEYERNALRFPARPNADTHLVRLRVQAAWDIHASMALFAQYNEAAGGWSLNGRARYHLREGTDIWIVYDERPAALARTPRSRSLLAKLTYSVVR